jgi:hypothetical protein
MLILDSHAHVDVAPSLGWTDTAGKLVQRMDQTDIAKAALSGCLNAPGPNPNSLQTIADEVEKYPARLIGYARMDLWFDDACIQALVDSVKRLGIRGVKLHPAHYTLYPFGPLTAMLAARPDLVRQDRIVDGEPPAPFDYDVLTVPADTAPRAASSGKPPAPARKKV